MLLLPHKLYFSSIPANISTNISLQLSIFSQLLVIFLSITLGFYDTADFVDAFLQCNSQT